MQTTGTAGGYDYAFCILLPVHNLTNGATEQRTLNVFRIGPVSFTTGTYEMASEHAGELKAASPYEFTFQICGNTKYIPREEAIDYQSYEGTNRPYVRETGDQLVQEYIGLLESIK